MEITESPYVVEVVPLKPPFFLELWSDNVVTWLRSPPQLKLHGSGHTSNNIVPKKKKRRRKHNGGPSSQDFPGQAPQGT